MPISGNTHTLPALSIASDGQVLSAANHNNNPLNDISSAITETLGRVATKETMGVATTLIASHVAIPNPHSQYELSFANRAAVLATNLSYLAVGSVIYLNGHTTAGIGGAFYKKISTPVPVKAWHCQSSDGSYFQLSEDRITFEMLGCIGNNIADDGATLNAAIYSIWGGHTAPGAKQTFDEIHGKSGATYNFATTVSVRQSRLRFIGNGARINCTVATAFDFNQDGTGAAGGNEEGAVISFDMRGSTGTMITGLAANFLEVRGNSIRDCVNGVQVTAVEAKITGNYIRDLTGFGIKLSSGITAGGTIGESQRCVVTDNKIWVTGGVGLHLVYGVGHIIFGNDIESNQGGSIYGQCCLSNVFSTNYFEHAGGVHSAFKFDNVAGPVVIAGRSSNSNTIKDSVLGGGYQYDFDITGNGNTLVNNVIGTGNTIIRAGSNNNIIKDNPGLTRAMITDLGNATTVLIGNVVTGIISIAPTKVPIRNPRGFFDVTGATTTGAVVFSPNEDDQVYKITFSPWDITNSCPNGAESCKMTVRGVSGFSWKLAGAPTPGTMRIHWEMVRF